MFLGIPCKIISVYISIAYAMFYMHGMSLEIILIHDFPSMRTIYWWKIAQQMRVTNPFHDSQTLHGIGNVISKKMFKNS